MILDFIREIFTAVIGLLQIPISIDGFTFSFYSILEGIIVLTIAIAIVARIVGGDD